MDENTIGLILGILCILWMIYTVYDNAVAKTERGGRVKKMDAARLNRDAKIIDVKTTTVGTKTKKEFRINVIFDDGFEYVKVVKPADTSVRFTTYTFTLSREQKMEVITEAIREHNKALGIDGHQLTDVQAQTGQGMNNALDTFSKRLFPKGEASKEYIKAQMKALMGDVPNEDDYLNTYTYCMTHYLVNGKRYDDVSALLPISHPEIKDNEIAKKVAAFAFMHAGTQNAKIDLSTEEGMNLLNNLIEELEKRKGIEAANADRNKGEYDEEVGLIREKPMFFHGVRDAESYLNSLYDDNGRKLHFGNRYSYSVDGIQGMLDCYAMMNERNEKVGELFLSIYGSDNYSYVPKGYKKNGLVSNANKPAETKTTTTENLENKEKTVENTNEPITNNIPNKKKYDASSATTAMSDILGEKTKTEDSSIKESLIPETSKTKPEEETKRINVVRNTGADRILYCRKCGTKLDPDSVFCKKCGTKIGG